MPGSRRAWAGPVNWTGYATNLSGSAGANVGTGVTAGADNTDGTAVTLISALGFNCERLTISIGNFFLATFNGSTLVTILYDLAGGTSWSTLVVLLGGHAATMNSNQGPSHLYEFDIYLPAGTSIGAKARTAHTATITGRVQAWASGGNQNPGSGWYGTAIEALGLDLTTGAGTHSMGTSHTPGLSGAYSSFASLGSPLTYDAYQVILACQGTMNGTSTSLDYFYQLGVSGAAFGPTYKKTESVNENGYWFGPKIKSYFPAGTQLQIRASSGTASADALDFAAYALR